MFFPSLLLPGAGGKGTKERGLPGDWQLAALGSPFLIDDTYCALPKKKPGPAFGKRVAHKPGTQWWETRGQPTDTLFHRDKSPLELGDGSANESVLFVS